MPKGESEVDKFFGDLPSEETKQVDIFEKEGAPAPEDKEKEGSEKSNEGDDLEKGGEPRKNRRHRRLEEQLQKEREARLIAEAKAEGRSEAERFTRDTQTQVPVKWLQIYGDTPESRAAWAIQKELFDEQAKAVREATLQEVEAREKKRVDEQKQFESFIDGELEGLEDEYNVDLTSDAPAARKARREFLELVAELSPKGEDGAITAYADFDAAWKQYRKGRNEKKPDLTAERRKELASRSLDPNSGGGDPPQRDLTPGFFGWMKDNGL